MAESKTSRQKYELGQTLRGESETKSVCFSPDCIKMSQDFYPEDVQSICRVCLAADRKDLATLITKDSPLANMFHALTSIDIQDEGFPTKVCKLCQVELENSYKFREKCIQSDNIIKSVLSKEVSQRQALELGFKTEIKEEDEDIQYLEDLSDDDVDYVLEDMDAEDIERRGTATKKVKASEEVILKKKAQNPNYNCTSCKKKFKKVKALRVHMRQKHESEADPNACTQCVESFTSEHDLALHETVHAKGPVWQCIKCQKQFHSRTVFRRHVRRHMARKRHACERCGKAFAERHALRRHARVHSGQPAPRAHACHLCDKRYSESGLLAAHLLRHSGARPCACAACGKAFPTARLLASHALVHSDHKPHACAVCGRRFRHESTLRTHRRTHTGEKPYVCAACGKAFIQNSNLTLHMRTHTGERPYECGVCARRFTSGSSLKAHARTHTGEKPYSCEICGKRFARLDMRAHMRLHSGERPFACSACPKAFPSASRLRDHTRIHTGEKPYECAMCPQKYPTKSHLAKHLKTHELKCKKKQDNRNVVILQQIDGKPYAENVVYTEIDGSNGDIHKDIGEQVPLEVTGELVLEENGEMKTELVMLEEQNICLSDRVQIVDSDVSHGEAGAAERGARLYQLDQSLLRIHSAGGHLTISQITSKMTANF